VSRDDAVTRLGNYLLSSVTQYRAAGQVVARTCLTTSSPRAILRRTVLSETPSNWAASCGVWGVARSWEDAAGTLPAYAGTLAGARYALVRSA
jgi:hypothetical protein